MVEFDPYTGTTPEEQTAMRAEVIIRREERRDADAAKKRCIREQADAARVAADESRRSTLTAVLKDALMDAVSTAMSIDQHWEATTNLRLPQTGPALRLRDAWKRIDVASWLVRAEFTWPGENNWTQEEDLWLTRYGQLATTHQTGFWPRHPRAGKPDFVRLSHLQIIDLENLPSWLENEFPQMIEAKIAKVRASS